MKIGYVRVSGVDQNEGRQIEQILQQGIDKNRIYVEKESGLKKNRSIFLQMKATLREGDQLYIDELSRLGRNYHEIIYEWKDVSRNIKSDIIVLDNETFSTLKFKELGELGQFLEDMMLSTLAYVYSQEIKSSKRRQAEGIALAKKRGKYKGRKPIDIDSKLFETLYKNVQDNKMTIIQMSKILEISESTCYRRIKEYKKELEQE